MTTYTLSLVAEAGANDTANTIVRTSLPLYVNWLDEYDADGDVVYNSVSKELEWSVGNIDAGKRKEFVFQVNIRPEFFTSEQFTDTIERTTYKK